VTFVGVQALVFDLDGTLVDSLDDIADHLNAALADLGFPACHRDQVATWVGHGLENLVARAVSEPARVPDIVERFRTRYRERPVVKTRVFAGLERTLDAIASGHGLAVLSNKPHDLTVAIAKTLLGRWPFRVVAGQRAGRPQKPDAAALSAVADELGVDAARCAMIGDSEVDIQTARAAGVPSVAVSWGQRKREVIVAAKPDYLVDTAESLLQVLQSLGAA